MTSLLRVQSIHKSFGALKAVANLNFDIFPCEVLGLIGPNGAGKTTAISLIGGAIRPDGGRIEFNGENIVGKRPHQLARRGLVRTFQSTNVYTDRSVYENVYRGAFTRLYKGFWHSMLSPNGSADPRAGNGEKLRALLQDVGLTQVMHRPAGNLPYGYQKMLGLAIALAAEPSLIMMDEPAAGLSAEEADQVACTIRQINQRGISVIVVDHNMRFMRGICNRIVVMHHGTELTIGTPDEVMSDGRVIEAYLGAPHEPA